jgi:hypothetical protein
MKNNNMRFPSAYKDRYTGNDQKQIECEVQTFEKHTNEAEKYSSRGALLMEFPR